jgi:hypothetical protein
LIQKENFDIIAMETYLAFIDPNWDRVTHPDNLDKEEYKKIVNIPWFVECNPDRYPRWYEKPDPRTTLGQSEIAFTCFPV